MPIIRIKGIIDEIPRIWDHSQQEVTIRFKGWIEDGTASMVLVTFEVVPFAELNIRGKQTATQVYEFTNDSDTEFSRTLLISNGSPTHENWQSGLVRLTAVDIDGEMMRGYSSVPLQFK